MFVPDKHFTPSFLVNIHIDDEHEPAFSFPVYERPALQAILDGFTANPLVSRIEVKSVFVRRVSDGVSQAQASVS